MYQKETTIVPKTFKKKKHANIDVMSPFDKKTAFQAKKSKEIYTNICQQKILKMVYISENGFRIYECAHAQVLHSLTN